MNNPTQFATVAIVGLPNGGKSALLNALVGEKLAAVSQSPQTTRGRILGVVNRGATQLAFLDTPGIHKPEHALNHRMLRHVDTALQEADLILWVVDADGFQGPGERDFVRRLKGARQPVYLVLNKLDLLSRSRLLEKVVAYKDLMAFKEIIPIAAKFQRNLDPLWAVLERDAPAGPWQFEADTFTDQTERSMAAEFIREKVLRKTRQELPHVAAVIIEQWLEAGAEGAEDLEPGGVHIAAQILVERPSHRRILIGRQGELIKDIRHSAQRELRKLLQRPVRLELFVKVEEGWRDDPARLDKLDLT
jgi:GTPase